jgi:ribonuclease III
MKKGIMDYKAVEHNLGFAFKNKNLLETSLTHRSYLNENRGQDLSNNERLEFLGDAVLELIISEYIFNKYSERAEGELTSIRSSIVRTESLAQESRKLELGKYLRMSKGEKDSGGEDKDYLLANTYEAVLGAIYLDQGIGRCKEFVKKTLFIKIDEIVKNQLYIDPKTEAQELIQAQRKTTPKYKVLKEEGPDHDKIFTVAIEINGKRETVGKGSSKQKAEEDAASKIIKILKKKE